MNASPMQPVCLQGDALQALAGLADASVDLFLVDLPYGTTACAWDCPIDLERMWVELHRVGTSHASFVFTAQQPFTTVLAASNLKELSHELIWEKPNGSNPFATKVMPNKVHENVLVFRRPNPTYVPQMTPGKPYTHSGKRSGGRAARIGDSLSIRNSGTRHPRSVLKFNQERGLHPTQKPVELMAWLVRTYSKPGDTVCDFTMGSGTTGVAAVQEGRRFIGVERDAKFFQIAKARVLNTHASNNTTEAA
jgi:DNA modification methylase